VRDTPRYSFPITNIGLLDVPPELQRVTGFPTDTNNYEFVTDKLSRLATQIDATWYVRAWGEHALKAGIQADWTTHDTRKGQKGNLVSLAWNRAFQSKRGKYGYYTVSSNPLEPRRGILVLGTAEGDTTGLFVQDTWRIGEKLTVNAGLRTEREAIPNYSIDGSDVPPMLEFGFGEKMAPRLGAAYDVRGDGRWKVYGSWGIFYDVFKYSLPSGIAQYSAAYRYTLDSYDWPNLLNDTACPPACPGTLISASSTGQNPELPFDGDLDPMRSQEAVFGI
jgi:outer membrane receptor protein involved in Fe transport